MDQVERYIRNEHRFHTDAEYHAEVYLVGQLCTIVGRFRARVPERTVADALREESEMMLSALTVYINEWADTIEPEDWAIWHRLYDRALAIVNE